MSTLLDHDPGPDSRAIGVRLRAYMGIQKISRTKLAMASGITRSSLANKLDGYVEFTVGEIKSIAIALGKTWLWVMTGDESPPPPVRRGEWGGDPNDGAPVGQPEEENPQSMV
jgi:transcriptional regulator with XRE-family HTH domain